MGSLSDLVSASSSAGEDRIFSDLADEGAQWFVVTSLLKLKDFVKQFF